MNFLKVRTVKSPCYGTDGSAGIDFFVPVDFKPVILYPGEDLLIPSGIKIDIPNGFMLLGADKSGVVTTKKACFNAGRKPKDTAFTSPLIIGAKIIDSDYQGEIHIHVINTGRTGVEIKPDMKIAQFILVPVVHAKLDEVFDESLLFEGESLRGSGGFGSTGS